MNRASTREERAPAAGLPRLIALSDCASYPDCPTQLAALCQEALPGTVLVVVRDRQQTRREKRVWAPKLAQTARACGQWLSVADDLELACELAAHGLHLGAHSALPTQQALSQLRAPTEGRGPLLTRAGHGWSRLADAELHRLSGLLISPVWRERKGRSALGVLGLEEQLQSLRDRAPSVPAYALGGVRAAHVAPSLAAGAVGVACIGALMTAAGRAGVLQALGAAAVPV